MFCARDVIAQMHSNEAREGSGHVTFQLSRAVVMIILHFTNTKSAMHVPAHLALDFSLLHHDLAEQCALSLGRCTCVCNACIPKLRQSYFNVRHEIWRWAVGSKLAALGRKVL